MKNDVPVACRSTARGERKRSICKLVRKARAQQKQKYRHVNRESKKRRAHDEGDLGMRHISMKVVGYSYGGGTIVTHRHSKKSLLAQDWDGV